MMNDCSGGIFASQVIRLIGNIYSQTMRIYICGGMSAIVSNQSEKVIKIRIQLRCDLSI